SSWCFYEVSGDTLRLCTRFTNNAPDNLPARFATDRDQDVVLLTFKRPKK
ncbi:MAG: hypothetical protein JO112_08100, partial [Planctomycetes bacterium]|nr:hypothetical protein [Planctomycetota bacterium]